MSEPRSVADRFRAGARRYPILADAIRWALPALIFGGVLRLLLTNYLPYAMWGADSRSFYTFAHKFVGTGALSLGEKRRYLYPLLMLPVSYLPGGALRWLPILQHTFGCLTLLALAYVVRKTLAYWRLWIVPVTLVYAGLPIVLWCEHELLGDHLFFCLLIWSFAGWIAWVSQAEAQRARRLFWTFFIPFALFILTKPAGRFVWPGLLLGFLMVKAWKTLRWPHAIALLALLAVTPTVGSNRQGAWLLYDATFPLTRLDTPQHADYKAEIRDAVEGYRHNLDVYYAYQHKETFYFLRDPGEQDERPLWKALDANPKLKDRLYFDLAFEGIKARPDLFLYLGLQRLAFDANASDFPERHFADGEFIDHIEQYYREAEKDPRSPVRIALALPRTGPAPPYSEFQKKLEPAPGSWPARFVQSCVHAYGTKLDLFWHPNQFRTETRLSDLRPTFLFWWLLAGLILSFLPRYRKTLGVWALTSSGYVYAVYLIAVVNVHYFAPIWPMVLVFAAIPGDVILRGLFRGRRERAPGPETT
jgi:hypothetical protein